MDGWAEWACSAISTTLGVLGPRPSLEVPTQLTSRNTHVSEKLVQRYTYPTYLVVVSPMCPLQVIEIGRYTCEVYCLILDASSHVKP